MAKRPVIERPVTLDEVEEFALPGSGTIKLSEIKLEFNKGNNLTAYYNAASGVPSGPPIKVTDFYGKSSGGGGPVPAPPSGGYGGAPSIYRNQKGQNANGLAYKFIVWSPGTGSGYPTAFSSRAGYMRNTTNPDYPPSSGTPYFSLGNILYEDLCNAYEKTYFQQDGGPETEFYTKGTWYNESAPDMTLQYTNPLASTQTLNHTYCTISGLANSVINAINSGKSFSIRLSNN